MKTQAVDLGSIRLRRAEESDRGFLLRVFSSSSPDLLVLQRLEEPQRSQLLNMQFEAQSSQYRESFPHSEILIIEVADQPVGRLWIDAGDNNTHIVDVTVLPEFRNNGIGAKLMALIKTEAGKKSSTCTLRVKKDNLAKDFYLRQGFCVIQDNGVYLKMEWKPWSGNKGKVLRDDEKSGFIAK